MAAAVQVTLNDTKFIYKKEIKQCKYREECGRLMDFTVSTQAFAVLSTWFLLQEQCVYRD